MVVYHDPGLKDFIYHEVMYGVVSLSETNIMQTVLFVIPESNVNRTVSTIAKHFARMPVDGCEVEITVITLWCPRDLHVYYDIDHRLPRASGLFSLV